MVGVLKRIGNDFCNRCDFCDIVTLITLAAVGGFHDFTSTIISCVLVCFLIFKKARENTIKIYLNPLSIAVFVISLFYLVSTFWAIDSGMAFVGFLKYLPLVPFLLILQQPQKKEGVLSILPFFSALMVVISSVGSVIPPIKNLFLVSGRLSGFFQYPNTFALLLLISELLILKKKKYKAMDFVLLAILILGLLYTGSRTVFLIFLVTNFLMILTNTPKKKRIIIFALAVVLLIAVVFIAMFGKEGNVLSRYLKIGLAESTFAGRLLYMYDALPLLLKYPFGLGYLGYHFMQGSFQSGVYNVSYVHNDFLQIALDIGVIPLLLFIAAIVLFFFKKQVDFTDKIILAAFVLHSLLDFNLQFVGMFMLLVLLLNRNDGKVFEITGFSPIKIIALLLVVINVYMCVPLALSQFTAYQASNALYPFNTRNKLLYLEQQEDVVVANEIAEDILKYNTQYYAPYSVKAKYCYSKGDFVGVIENETAALQRNRFRYTEYKEYSIMLVNGILAYEQIGDTASADILKEELLALKRSIEGNKDKISKLGSMIDEQPITTLPSDILKYIEIFSKESGD